MRRSVKSLVVQTAQRLYNGPQHLRSFAHSSQVLELEALGLFPSPQKTASKSFMAISSAASE